jgi:hypothetical protein
LSSVTMFAAPAQSSARLTAARPAPSQPLRSSVVPAAAPKKKGAEEVRTRSSTGLVGAGLSLLLC